MILQAVSGAKVRLAQSLSDQKFRIIAQKLTSELLLVPSSVFVKDYFFFLLISALF